MIATRIVCLANSFKEGGRCLAGIELDTNNKPVFLDGRPKWIRPVCNNTQHGEIPNYLAEPFHILDIIELNIIDKKSENYQSENVLFEKNSIRRTGSFNSCQLPGLIDNRSLILGSRNKAVPSNLIGFLNYSLMLVNVTQFGITQKIYEDNLSDRPQIRMVFVYNGIKYDFPVTDPVFLYRYQKNPDLLEGVNDLFLTLSLGVVWEDWYYKLVAGIIF